MRHKKGGKPILGEPKKATLKRNCLLCQRYVACRDPDKRASYACTRFAESEELSSDDINLLFDTASKSKADDVEKVIANASDEESIADMIDTVLKSGVPVPPDLKLNDRHIPRPKNIYQWLTDPHFIGSEQKPFARQVQVGLTYMSEICPRCSDMDFLETMAVDTELDEIEDRVVMLEYGICPECGVSKAELFLEEEINDYWTLAGLAGQRSSKTITVNAIEGYNTCRWLVTPNLPATYNIMPSTILTSTYTAVTFGQVKNNFWTPLSTLFNTAPWFKEYHRFLTDQGRKHGEELFTLNETIIRYRHKNILMYPAAPSMRSMRGACVTASTMVNTDAGFLSMSELIKNDGYNKTSFTIAAPSGPREVSHTYKVDNREVIRVKTRNGYHISGTHEHPMLVLTPELTYEWRRLDQIKVGDFIVSRTANTPVLYGNDTTLSREMATLLGYLTANGSKQDFSSGDEKVIKRFKRAAKSVTGIVPSSWGGGEQRVPSHRILYTTKGRKENFFDSVLKPLGYTAVNSYEKEIPLVVRQSPKEIMHEYLESYFECDGHVDGWYNKSGNGSQNTPAMIVLASASRKLIHQLHTILLHAYGIVGRMRFNIAHNKTRRTTEGPKEQWQIAISGYDAWLFLNTFKRAKVQRYANRFWYVEPGWGSDRRVVPYVNKIVWEAYARRTVPGSYNSRIIELLNGERVLNSIRPRFFSAIRRNKQLKPNATEAIFYGTDWEVVLPRLYQIDRTVAKRIEKMLAMGAHYEEVVSVKHRGERTVYDVTVPQGHAFIANGMVSHNTRISAAIDEYDWFPTGKTKGNQEFERLNAVEVFKALENSLSTMRGAYLRRLKQGYSNLPKPLFSNISSPSAKNGALMTLYRQSTGSRWTYTFKYPTWDFNPLLPREVFDEQFRLNPVAAERDYACNPPLGTNSWLPKLENVDSCFTRSKNGVKVMSTRVKTRNDKMVMSSTLQISRDPKSNYQGILALDAGYSNNSFAFAIAFPKNIPDREVEPDEDGELDFNVDVEIFAVGEVIPKQDIPISFTRMYKNVLLPICQQFNIAYVISDRWQNIKMLQDLEDASGIEYLEHRLSYAEFTALKEALFDGRVDLPRLEEDNKEKILDISSDDYPTCFYLKPVSHLYYQLGTVQDTGASIIKGSDATDDIFRCVALSYTVLQLPGVLEGLMPVEDEHQPSTSVSALATKNTATAQVQSISGVGMSFRSNNRGTISNGISGSNLGVIGRKR